jgi:hypothetical protein
VTERFKTLTKNGQKLNDSFPNFTQMKFRLARTYLKKSRRGSTQTPELHIWRKTKNEEQKNKTRKTKS